MSLWFGQLPKGNTRAILELTSETLVVRAKTKTEVATIKMTPQCRVAWETAASAETRSLANTFEVAILDYCQRHHVAVPTLTVDEVPRVARTPRQRLQRG